MLSIRKWANFLPVGKDFTIPARNFLPVGKGLRGSPAKVTKRQVMTHIEVPRASRPCPGTAKMAVALQDESLPAATTAVRRSEIAATIPALRICRCD